jgi:hypothetical protein
MSIHRLTLLMILLVCSQLGGRAQEGLLLRYSFDEGQGDVVRDLSGNGLNGETRAAWVASPVGRAVAMDGQPASIVRVQLPEAMRFGTGSWTFSAWLKPTQFHIDDAQNQRRLFAFGVYPDAYLVIDLMGSGHLSHYFCYRNAEGEILATGGSGGMPLTLGQWAHVALVCDRKNGVVACYVNGFKQGETRIPPTFRGDFSLGGELTLGSSWHNYYGVMDEVSLYRRALTRAEVRAEFAKWKERFGVTESPEAAEAERRERYMQILEQSRRAWLAGDYAGARAVCQQLIGSPDAPPVIRSIAHLRIAESWAAQRSLRPARNEFQKIAANADYPAVHRMEARERSAELDRIARGLSPRDPAATRTRIPPVTRFAARIVVSPRGKDSNPGTSNAPVATLTRARDLVRSLKARGIRGAIAVEVMPGEYRVTAPLTLTKEDSGTPGAPVVYRATQPGKAVFYGGRRLRGFQPVTDPQILRRLPEEARAKVMQCDLRAQGITDFGRLAVRGFGQPPSPPTLELYVNGRPMTLARWPNTGFVGIRRLLEPGNRNEGKPSVFEYLDDRHARWTQAEDAWLFGYFRYLWADATIKIGRIDPAARTVTTHEAYHYDLPGMDTGQGIQYYAFNLLEEIDQPGEWYLDRQSGILYLYPPTDLTKATVEVGMLSEPMIVMNGVSDVRLEGLSFDLARFNGLVLTDCRRCLIAGCTIRRMAGNGVMIHGGEQNGLLGCDIHTIGRRASEVIGGDRQTLKPGRHFVENCRIYDFGRIDRTYTPAVQLEGVGNRVAHNLMYDCPSSVMRIEGNDHLIEFNEVHSAVLESDDQGAMELFGNPTYRGVIFRYNRFTNCGKPQPGVAVHGQAAIRLDDVISGILIYGNIFIRSANGNFGAVQMNSGRDNIIDNNLFEDCRQGISGGWYGTNPMWARAASADRPPEFILSELYLQRYPAMRTMLTGIGINYVWRNTFLRCGPIATGNTAHLEMLENGDRALFRPIPSEEIGLYQDRYRASWPVPIQPVKKQDWRVP